MVPLAGTIGRGTTPLGERGVYLVFNPLSPFAFQMLGRLNHLWFRRLGEAAFLLEFAVEIDE